ncbi:beta-lactamase hydrolase domain-containing protein [Pseudoxanthomonas koreensis]|uniref:beta-lactamase hydrolase domain-containing protein n=1 Tax=Pseudoxanthomonas koreensis TaxID=266061 RepID=UPI0035A60FD1
MPTPRLPIAQARRLAALVLAAVCLLPHATAGNPPSGNGTPQAPALSRFANPVDGIHTGGRITAEDLPALRAAGITHVIDLTPGAETPDFDEAAAVRGAGLSYANLPIAGPADLSRESVDAFDQLLRDTQGPTLVHCASGNRVGALAALRAVWLEGAEEEAAIAEGRRWGLRSLEGKVREQLARDRCLALAPGQDAAAACAAGG